MTEQDILLREEFDALKKKYPKKFDVVYVLDKPSETWTGTFRYHSHFASGSNLLFPGPTGYISSEIIKQHVAPATLGDKVKVFVCGALFRRNFFHTAKINLARLWAGPPPQVASIAGKKAGMKQGELGGILKELGYTEDQVCFSSHRS